MKELFLFIRNNRIIYKVSIVSILILMLISVMQINPENVKKNNVGAENGIDYTIEFRASDGKFYKKDTDTEIDVTSMGLSSHGSAGEEGRPQVAVLEMNNCNIPSTADIALYINGDTYLYVSSGTENNIISSYSGDNSNYGIKANGDIVVLGAGTLNIEVSALGNNGVGISVENNLTVSSGNIEVSALGNNGVGISVEKNLTVQGGNIISKGMGRAVQYSNLITTADTKLNTHTGVIIASTDIDCKSVEKYSNDNISRYKHMELGIICDYYLKYNSETGDLKKVLSNGTENNINFEDVPGLSKSEEKDKNGVHILILDGFNFVTSCQYGLYICINDNTLYWSTVKVNDKSINRIVVDYNGKGVGAAIYCNRNLEINGAGNLDIISTPPKDNSLASINRDVGIQLERDKTIKINDTSIKCILSGCRFEGIRAGIIEFDNIKLSVFINTSDLCYGILVEDINITNSNIVVDVKSDNAKGYGIYSSSVYSSSDIIVVRDSSMVVKGNNYALKTDKSISIDTSNIIAKGNQYGIYSGKNITVSSGNIEASALGNNGVGISVKNNLTVQGGNIISKGMGQAVQYSSLITTKDTELNTHTGVIIASTDIDCKSVENYIFDSISNYKYMELGTIYDYYLRYDPVKGYLEKVSYNENEKKWIGSSLDFSNVPGLYKSDTRNNDGEYELIMDGFNFVTTATKGLEIRNTQCWDNVKESYDFEQGAAHTSVIKVVDDSKNRIVVKSQGEARECGVIECNTKMNIIGSGSIDITYDSSNSTFDDPFYGIILGKSNLGQIANLRNLILTIENTEININLCGPNSVDKSCRGISCGEGIYKNMNLNINVSNKLNSKGITNYDNGATSFDNSNVNIDLKCESASYVFGIDSKIISIKNSNLKVKGKNQAFTSLPFLDSDGDYDSAVLCTSKTYKPSIESYIESDLERYPILSADNIGTYKYVEIGKVPNYYYRYKDNTLYKVSKDSSTETLLDSYPSGCTVVDGKLQLNGFNFVTTAPKVIDIVNTDASVGTSIEVLGENNLRNVSSTGEINTICSANNLTIDGTGTLNLINKNNATCRGIYVDNDGDSAILSVNNITLNSNIEGTIAKGIEANELELNKATTYINVDSSSSTANDCIGIYTSGEMSILNNSNITAKTASPEKKGYGIYSGGKFSASASTITAQGKDGAIYLVIADNAFVNSIVKGSNNYDGTDSTDVTLSNTTCNNYRYVLIKYVKVISVDISWGNMDYKYTEGNWNSSNHTYDLGTWAPISEGGDKITVTNNSNVSINANITYGQDPGYNSTEITGKIVETPEESTAITMPKNISVANSFEAYLKLSGKLDTAVPAKTVIGNVKVTITE